MLFNPSGLLFISHFLMLFLLFLRLFFSFFFALFFLLFIAFGVVSRSCFPLLVIAFICFFCFLCVCRIYVLSYCCGYWPFPPTVLFFLSAQKFWLRENSETGATVRVQTDHDGAVVRHPPSWADLKFKNSSRKISFLKFLFFLFLFLFHPRPKWIEKENWKNK